MLLQKLYEKELIHPPKFLLTNTQFICIIGSRAYGCEREGDNQSDNDIYGWCIPALEEIFPHLRGEVLDFGSQKQRFYQWLEHGIIDKEERKEYDFTIFSVVKYFDLCMKGTPNTLETLFVNRNLIIHSTQVSELVRENRKLFLSKKLWHSLKGYSYSQMSKIRSKNPTEGSNRFEDVQKHGYDLKFATHTVRLLNEAEQVLSTGDLDLQQNREQLKSIRRGEWKEQDVYDWFNKKEKELESLYLTSKIPYAPDEDKIKKLLLSVLEHHYGSLDKVISLPDKYKNAMLEISKICQSVGA